MLIRGESNVVYSPPGYLIFVRDGTLLAQAFDLGSLQLADGAFPLPSYGGERSPALGSTFGLFSVSQNGVLAYAGAIWSTSSRPGTTAAARWSVRSASLQSMAPSRCRRTKACGSGADWGRGRSVAAGRRNRYPDETHVRVSKAIPSGRQTGGSSCSPTRRAPCIER